MGRNLIILFDGTWNNTRDKTNVVRMHESIDSTGEHDPQQPCRYLSGVGTSWHTWLTGGLFGRGLSENIQAGYTWLAQLYRPEDRLFVFGFSRGAYTARSLVGLVRKCGLLKSPEEALLKKAYALYRDKKVAPTHKKAVDFRATHSREMRVYFIGVWDTVGSLGVPLSGVPFSKDYYRWHDTRLSKIVDYAYHAVATDERRRDYAPALWTQIKPENREVEQRWFIGAHSNVGGGYDKQPPDCLAQIALRWMQDKAEQRGLNLRGKMEVLPEHCMGEINDSHAEFAFGLYKWVSKAKDRRFGKGVSETVDPSVWLRWKQEAAYRPASLKALQPGHERSVDDVRHALATDRLDG
jgi:uncharacterized protein (DUF2235 family)